MSLIISFLEKVIVVLAALTHQGERHTTLVRIGIGSKF
ncbi:hypothetical protein TRICHSKD4_4770 [Roseibium sp. TrichSKD4]|nr:hypothetical protein TRICHSKD4_4770 [Roseibium sp. TrichSKD4]